MYVIRWSMYSTPASVGHADQQQAGLDVSSLERDVQRYFEHGLAASTRRTYQAGINKFANFCASYNISHPLPVSQTVLCLFISHLANLGLAYATIKTYLAAIRHLHISMDLPEPRLTTMPKLAWIRFREGYKKSFANDSQYFETTPGIIVEGGI